MSLNLIQAAALTFKPSAFLDYKAWVKTIYEHVKSRMKSYNYQQFSEDLGFNGTTVWHAIAKGYRPLSVKNGDRIADAIKLEPGEREYLQALITYCNARRPEKKQAAFLNLVEIRVRLSDSPIDKGMLDYMSCWINPVIREMTALPDFHQDPDWVAEQLVQDVDRSLIKQALALVEKLGMVFFDRKSKRYRQSSGTIDSGAKIRGMGALRYHLEMLDIARQSLLAVEGKRRNYGAVTVSCDEETAQKIKELANVFQREVARIADEGGAVKDQIYQINIQMFPFTKGRQS